MKNKIPKNLVIHCRTEELAKRLMQRLDNLGYTWFGGERYSSSKTYWEIHREDTAYLIDYGGYGDVNYYGKAQLIDGKAQLIDCETFLERYLPNTENIIYLRHHNKVKLKFTL